MLFLCRCYVLPSALLSHDSNTSDLVINTGIEEAKLLSFVLQCTRCPFSLSLQISSGIIPSCLSYKPTQRCGGTIYCEITSIYLTPGRIFGILRAVLYQGK